MSIVVQGKDAAPWRGVWKKRLTAVAHRIVLSAADANKRRRANILACLLVALMVVGLVFVMVDAWGWLADGDVHGAYNTITGVAFCLALLVTWVINRRGAVTVAAILHLICMSAGMVVFFLYTSPQQTQILFVEPVVVAAFVLVPWAAFPWAAVAALSFAAINDAHHGASTVNMEVALALLGVATLSWLVASYLSWAVSALHKTASDLEQGIVARGKAEEERRQVEAALRLAEQRSQTLFETSPVGIMLFDTDLTITECNERLAVVANSSRERLIGHDSGQLHDKRLVPAMHEALCGRTGSYEGPTRPPGGETDTWVSFTASPLLGPQNEVVGGIGVVTDLSDRKQAEDLVERLAFYDPVTDLANRTLFLDRLGQEIAASQRTGHRVTVAVIDIDNFKHVNDTVGHGQADRVLQAMAARLAGIVRRGDTLARMGGDEFALLIAKGQQLSSVIAIADKIQAAFREPWEIDGLTIRATASMGFATYPDDAAEVHALVGAADTAMRRAKDTGRDAYQFFDPTMNVRAAERLKLEHELQVALKEEQLVVYYQPQVDLRDGHISGAEALVRWQHPDRGLVMPPDFVPLAEETGLIDSLDTVVLGIACRQAAAWRARGGGALRLAVNISPRHLHSPSLLSHLRTALETSGFTADELEIELTETAIIDNSGLATSIVSQLRELGATVALDDFGTGYSSLSHLHRLPINRVKVDRSFVSRIEDDDDAAAIVKAVIDLGHSLGLRVVAEGVETEGQLAYLKLFGCDEAQGYLFARPLPAEEFAKLFFAPAAAAGRPRGPANVTKLPAPARRRARVAKAGPLAG